MAALLAALSALLLFRLKAAYFTVGTLDYPTLYYASLGLLVVTIICLVLLVRSPFGLRLMAVRDDEEAAAELGVNSFLVKIIAFTVSAFFVGIAGSLIALQSFSLEPYSAFSMNWAINMVIMTIIGGILTTIGPLLGAGMIFTLQQQFQSSSWSTLIIGILLIIMIRLAPEGIWVLLRKGLSRLAQLLMKL